MKFSASFYFLASLQATLVLMTTSIPQSSYAPINHQAPKGCPGVGAINWHQDLKHKLVKRDSLSSGTPARALDARVNGLPYGNCPGGGQTDPFIFRTSRAVQLIWNFAGYHVVNQIVGLYQVVQNGPDKVIAISLAASYECPSFTPIEGVRYYIKMWGGHHLSMEWGFRPV